MGVFDRLNNGNQTASTGGLFSKINQKVDETKQYADEMKAAYENNPAAFNLEGNPEYLTEATPEHAAENKQYADAMKSAYESNPDAFKTAEQPSVFRRIQNAIGEYTVPNAPMIKSKGPDITFMDIIDNIRHPENRLVQGSNAREEYLKRNDMQPATGAPKFVGIVSAPFFVPGAQLGTANDVAQGAKTLLSRFAPQMGKVANSATVGASAGAAAGFGSEYAQGTGDLQDAAIAGASGAALGGTVGGVAPVVGDALKKFAGTKIGESLTSLFNRKNTIAPELEQAAEQNFNAYKQPAGPKTLDDVTRDIMEEASNRITPPLENPKLLDKYIMQHLPDVPRAEINALDYNAKAELAGYIRDNLSVHDIANQVAKERGITLIPEAPMAELAPETVVAKQIVDPIQQPIKTTKTPPAAAQERGFINTLRASEKVPETLRERLSATYKPLSNEKVVELANKRVGKDIEEATSYVLGKSRATAEKVTTAHRLIDEYTKANNHEMAVTVAEHIAEELTRAGQTVQAASIYNRLTPEGVLVHAQRIAKKANESMSALGKEVSVTPEMAAQLTDLASTTQRMTGVKDLANDVVSILERAKTGEKLNDIETTTLKKFVEESKQFVSEVEKKPRSPRPPKQPSDKRIRDNVVSFFDAQEQAAKERLRARGIRISSTPLDVWADFAVIGAAKMGKGAIKFADWSAEMIKDLGEEIRPHLESLYEKAKETFELSAKKVSEQTVSKSEKIVERVIKTKQLDQTSADNLRTLAAKVSGLSGDAKRIASQDLQAILQTLEKPSIGKRISSIQTMSQLLNPKTILVRNPIGNEIFYRIERINKLVATPIDWTRVKLFGGQRSVTFRTHNQGQYWSNFLTGVRAGWKGVNVDGLQSQFDLGPAAFSGKWNPLTYLEKTLGASLKGFDYAAYGRAVNNTLGELATLRAINEGLTGAERTAAIQKYIRAADENMIKIADEYGRYVTFQDNNILSRGLTGLKRGLNFGKDFGLGDLIIKYPKTPGALLMRALEFSPAGFLRSGWIAIKPLLRKGAEPNTPESMMALTRAITGTFGLSGLGYFFVDKGVLTGSASKDKDVRDLQRSAGQGQYQVNVSALKRWALSGFDPDVLKLKEGDTLYTYDWAQPVSMAISMGANAKQSVIEGAKKSEGAINLLGTAYNSLEGGVNSLVEQSVLKGVKSAFDSTPGQTVTDKIVDILSDIPSSFVPSALNQVNQLMDNTKRETYSPDKLEQSLNKAQSRIPGLAGKLPQQYDTLGRQKETYQDNNAFNVLFNPGYSTNYELSPEARMIVNLINETGDESLAPRVPSKSIQVKDDKGQPVTQKLTGEQFSRIQQLQGEETRKLISKIPEGSSNKSKADRIKKDLTKAGEDSKSKLKKEMGVK